MARFTTFAGLTALEPNEPLTEDGSSFQSRNPDIIDRFLEVGAVTHKHDAHERLANPDKAPSASAVTSGGSIRADQTIHLGYTLEDDENGETILSPTVTVTTQQPYDPPASTPSAAIDYTGGSLRIDTFYYAITLIDSSGGETPLGPYATVEREPGFSSAKVNLQGLAADLGINDAIAWRLYRATGGGKFEFLASGSTGTYTDDGSVAVDCAQTPPADNVNTTNSTNTLLVTVPSGGVVSSGTTVNVYASLDGSFLSPALLDTYPVSSAGRNIDYRTLDLDSGSPPDVSTTLRGANKIDPDTDLLDWHWKRPVANSAALGSGDQGDVRLSFDDLALYAIPSGQGGSAASAGTWKKIALGSALIAVYDEDGPRFEQRDELEFKASAGARVGVASGAGGRATVTFSTDANPQASGTIATVFASGSTPVRNASGLAFRASGVASVGVEQSPTGSALVTIASPSRRWASATANAASAASATADIILAKGYRLLKISASQSARLRVYSDAAARNADASRGIDDPVNENTDHGVMLDFVVPSADLIWRITPQVDGANLEDIPTSTIPVIITNLDAAGDVTVALLYVPTEG